MKKSIELNNVTKILLVILIIAISYFIIFLILRPFLIAQPTSMAEMMNRVMGGSLVETSNSLISLIIALIIGIIISFYIFKDKSKERDEFSIIRKALSDDEKRILDEIKKAGKITQDSLRFRLDWSKAKVSTILTNLDKKGIIQRQRTGKTYNIHLQNAK